MGGRRNFAATVRRRWKKSLQTAKAQSHAQGDRHKTQGHAQKSTAEMDPPITSSDMMPPSSGPCPESTGPCPDLHAAAVGADENQSEEEDLENFIDISDNSDLFHVQAKATEEPRTDEDKDMAIVDTIVPHLRISRLWMDM